MNIPNMLTTIRLILIPVFILIFFSDIHDALLISFLVFLTAGLTDVLDGYIARKYNMITKWGSVLDPLADKLMSITVLLCLAIKEMIPPWVLVIIGAKELVMIVGAAILFNRGSYVSSKAYGKVATVLFYISVITLEIFSRTIGLLMFYITVAAALFALIKYIENFHKVNKKAS